LSRGERGLGRQRGRLRRGVGVLLPGILCLAAIVAIAQAQETDTCETAVAGAGDGTAVQKTPEDAVLVVLPQLEGTLPPPQLLASEVSGRVTNSELSVVAAVEFKLESGVIVVAEQSNGLFILDHFVLCGEVAQ